jgi:hypothetical protein
MSSEHFQEVVQFLGGLQGGGKIDSFETVLLTPHGGDLNGFMLIRGDASQISELQASEEWQMHVTRAGFHLAGFGAVRGVTGEGVMAWMARWNQLLPD